MARYRGLSSSQTTALAELARFAGDHGLGREITLRLSDDLVLAKVALGLPDTVPLPCHPRTIHALVRIGALVHRDGQVERRYWLTGLAGDCLDYTNLSPIARLCYDARFAAGRFVRTGALGADGGGLAGRGHHVFGAEEAAGVIVSFYRPGLAWFATALSLPSRRLTPPSPRSRLDATTEGECPWPTSNNHLPHPSPHPPSRPGAASISPA